MRRLSLGSCWVLSCLALLVAGCGKDPFVPERRAKSLPTVAESDRSKPTFLVFVVPGAPSPDLLVWAMRAQQVANDKRVIFRIMGPPTGETTVDQPEIIRKAVAEGASALIVYPGDSPELSKAIAEAEAKGVPIVLIAKSLPALDGVKPFTVVEAAPFIESAGQIVAATIEDLKKASQPLGGTALVTVDKVTDDSSSRRVSALKSAAELAKFRRVVTVPFDSSTPDSARVAVLEAIKTNPDVSVVLADDAEGLIGAAHARIESKAKPIFFVGGYTEVRKSSVIQQPTHESCYVEANFSELGSQAVLVALSRLRGEPVGSLGALKQKFTKTDGNVWTEGMTIIPMLRNAAENPEPAKNAVSPKPGGDKPQ